MVEEYEVEEDQPCLQIFDSFAHAGVVVALQQTVDDTVRQLALESWKNSNTSLGLLTAFEIAIARVRLFRISSLRGF